MTRHTVPEPITFDLLGPYLSTRVRCPVCQHDCTLIHTEGPGSPVKPIAVCPHIRAYTTDDDGLGSFEFEESAA